MCGRYVSISEPDELRTEFDITTPSDVHLPPNYNVAPTQSVYAVIEPDDRQLVAARWGLIPSWAKDPAIGNRMINARVETAASKPSFRAAWRRRRALIPAQGYYEWAQRSTGSKQPYYFHPRHGHLLALAGLYEMWKVPGGDQGVFASEDMDGEWLRTVTILTQNAAGAAVGIHDRMPVVVPSSAWDAWLDPTFDGDLSAVVEQADSSEIVASPVSTRVNSPRNNDPELLAPIEE